MLASHLFPVLPAQHLTPMTKAKINIKLVYRRFGYMGFDNVRKTRKMVTSLEFDDAHDVAELTRLYNPCEKRCPVCEVNKKL